MAFYRCTFTGLIQGQTVQNVIHMQPNETTGPIAGVADNLQTNWINVIRLNLSNSLTWINIMVQDVSTSPPAQAFNKAISIAGNIGGNSPFWTPACILVSLKTANAGRAGRGRIYVPGMKSDGISINLLSATYRDQLQVNINTLLSYYQQTGGGGVLAWCIAPRVNGSANLKYVTSATVRTIIGVQRRRNFGVGI